MIIFLLAFLAAIGGAFFLTPLVRLAGVRFGALDRPVERSVHRQPVPTLGGLAIAGAFAVAVLMAGGPEHAHVMGILAGGAVILLVGVGDDLFNLSPFLKLLGQAAAGGVLLLFGVQIGYLTDPLRGGMFSSGWAGAPLTVLWVVAVINTVNLIDGLDGLAAGISGIASLVLFAVALLRGQVEVAVLTAALAGACFGFLPHNFNRKAKIFLGDTGAMFLGFAIAAVAVDGTLKSTTAIALAVPVLALGLPIFDTAFAILRRLVNGRPIVAADRNHIHHRLMAAGLSQRQVVVILYLVSVFLGLAGLAVDFSNGAWTLVGLMLVGLTLGAHRLGVLELKDKGLSG